MMFLHLQRWDSFFQKHHFGIHVDFLEGVVVLVVCDPFKGCYIQGDLKQGSLVLFGAA